MVNYRDLLVKYINYVAFNSNTSDAFIYDTMPNDFNEEETLMLKLLDIEATTLWENKNIIKGDING